MHFTIAELDKLLQLLDIATKSGGLIVANDALPLAVKIQQLAKEIQSVDVLSKEE